VEFALLGSLELRDGAGRPVKLRRHKARVLLGLLLSQRNRPVSASTLVDWLWNAEQPPSARANLQSYVSDLRRALRAADLAGCLHTTATGYLLQVRPEQVDADLFQDLADAGQRALRRDVPALAAERLTRALGLWRGTTLEGMEVPAALRPDFAALNARRLEAITDCAAARLSLGQHHQLVLELPALVEAYRTHEPLWRQLMLAYYRCGRHREALMAYHRLGAQLRRENAAGPSESATKLYRQILHADPGLTSAVPAVTAGTRVLRQLPAPPGRFVGRQRVLADLDRMLPALGGGAGSVAIVGGPGIGKSALALHWAHRVATHFPDGQLHVDLRGYAAEPPVDPLAAVARLLRDLGATGQTPDTIEEASAQYRSILDGRRVLIVLDNVRDTGQVRPLLPGSANCLAVVTSRDRLDGLVVREGAQRVRLGVLTPVEASVLLTEMRGTGRVSDPDGIGRLALRCGYLPLALRIAGAHLGDGRPVPVNPLTLTTADGEVSVRASFELSYQLLPAGERSVFRMLGLIPPGSLTVAAIAAATGGSRPGTRALLDRLAGANLVEQVDSERYRMHPLLHGYARQCAVPAAMVG
jgi:DNA-binding SARP family transcriptional activator